MATVRTVQQAINRAFGKLSLFGPGEPLPPEDNAIAKVCFQDMMGEWVNDQLMVPFTVLESFTLTAGTLSYTVGETAPVDLNTVRPEQIDSAFIREDNYDYPVNIIGEEAYNRIALKSEPWRFRPYQLWYNPTVPNGTITVWPSPSSAVDLFFSSEKPFTEPTSVTANMMAGLGYPRNYHNIIVYNLAVELAPEYGKTPADSVIVKAEKGKRDLISLNAARTLEPAVSELARSTRRDYDILYR
ncbi:hypothetical protein LCGC14_1902440 [marine sediment metagenome]|uniref:Uncharacterized protein n=1 Tax=marine sediment metagenome TaxID=412755 RepID=A0A0F9IA17_9ZZZZ|nr:hypothetical protein [Desulfobacterales bacterium]